MQVEALLLGGNTDDSSKEHAMMKPILSQDNVAIGEKTAEYVARLVCMPHCLAPEAVQTIIGT